MKWLSFLICSLITATGSAQLFDTVKCLPPLENDEHLFPRCKEIYGNLEFLYWTVDEGALDYAIKMKNRGWGPDTDSFQFANGKVRRATYDLHPGVRLLLGFYNAPKYWELFSQYTYYQTWGSDKVKKPEEKDLLLVGTFPQPTEFPLAFAKSHVKLNYQIVDVMFSRVFDPNPHLRMRLIAGISGAFIDQDWNTGYFDDNKNSTLIRNEWRYNAGGLKMGITADWWWKWSLYFTGKASIAGFSGRYTNRSTIKTDYQPSGDYDIDARVQDITNKDNRYAQQLQLLLGPAWYCIGKSYHAEIFIGYELNGWLNLQEVYRSSSGLPSSSKLLFQNTSALMLQGLTLRATAGF